MTTIGTLQGYLGQNGFVQQTGFSAATGLANIPAKSQFAVIQCESKDVRWRDDGTDPTTTVGMVLTAGSTLIYTANFSNIKFIEVASGAKLNISYYKVGQ